MSCYLRADIYHVGLEAQYDYHTIQSAVDICSEGDTIYVHPGIYNQSVEIQNKSISLLSLYAISGNVEDIENTIISGNELSVLFFNCPGRSVFQGFTIRDCVNYWHFPFAMDNYTVADLRDCIFTNNRIYNMNCAVVGIGYMADIMMSNCMIYHNYGVQWSGIYKNMQGTIHFDPIRRNSIYSNWGGLHCDIYYGYEPTVNTTPLDTLYLDIGTSDFTDPLCYWGINNIVVNQVSEPKVTSDLYVAPWGNDSNSGMTAQSPLRTIYKATRLACPLAGDSLTIHIASGTYAFNNFEDLRLGVRPGVILKGDADNLPILDGQQMGIIVNNAGKGLLKLENFKINNSSMYAICYSASYISPEISNPFFGKVVLSNLKFNHNHVDVAIFRCQDVQLSNITSISEPDFLSFSSVQLVICQNVKIENSIFMGKHGGSSQQEAGSRGFSISTGQGDYTWADNCRVDIINSIIAQNFSDNAFYEQVPNGIAIDDYVNVNLINSILVDNNSGLPYGASIYMDDGGTCDLYNTVIWNNRPYNILMIDPECQLTAHHSFIEDAAQSYLYPNWILQDGNVVYDDTNLGAEAVPTFVGSGLHRYMPVSSSAVIDAGSLDYPEGVQVPLTDLAGNPRVYGSAIDLGPYEWQGTEFDFTFIQNNEQVTFIPNCNQPINDIHWDFDMDGNIDSEELMPTYTYTANGNYSVGCYINHGQGGITKHNIVTITTSADDHLQDPEVSFTLSNYPNPFNPSTTIKYNNPTPGEVILEIFNIRGQLVRTLVNEELKSGSHSVVWDGKDNKGKACGSGIYFSRLETNGKSVTNKMVLMK